MLVSIVGLDGAGKSSVTRELESELPRRGQDVQRIERWDIVDNPVYPTARFMRPDIPDTRACLSEMPNPPRFMFLMWSIGMALLGRNDEPDVDITLLDGYWMKHAAAEIVYGLERPWVESVVAGLPASDLVIHLSLAPEVAWERKVGVDVVPYECGMDLSCSRDSFLRHQYALQEVLQSWARPQGWVEIDATMSLASVTAAVADVIGASDRYATDLRIGGRT